MTSSPCDLAHCKLKPNFMEKWLPETAEQLQDNETSLANLVHSPCMLLWRHFPLSWSQSGAVWARHLCLWTLKFLNVTCGYVVFWKLMCSFGLLANSNSTKFYVKLFMNRQHNNPRVHITDAKYLQMGVYPMMCLHLVYHQTSNTSHIKSPNLNVSRLILQLSLLNPLKPGVKS